MSGPRTLICLELEPHPAHEYEHETTYEVMACPGVSPRRTEEESRG